jgi:Mg2+ and Co2+ transporter CorA
VIINCSEVDYESIFRRQGELSRTWNKTMKSSICSNDLVELVESFHDTINSIPHVTCMASVSMQKNDTMRILTIFTAIPLPLTLIPSIYDMYARLDQYWEHTRIFDCRFQDDYND